MLDNLTRDVTYALRMFRRNPGFAAVAVLTIALGVGINTAIFSVVQAVLLRPLPYQDPHRLVFVVGALTNRDVTYWPTSPPDFVAFRERVTRLAQLEAVSTLAQPLTSDGAVPEQVEVGAVTPGFLAMLGARPIAGRLFLDEDATPVAQGTPPGQGPPAMIVLSHELWLRRFGGDPSIVGHTVELNGTATVIGVVEPGFALYLPPQAGVSSRIDVWLAPRMNPATAPGNNVFLRMVGRLAPGATLAEAQQQINDAVNRIRAERPSAATAGLQQTIVPLQEDVTRDVRPLVLALLGAVGFVLLIACANVSNLMLVRASARMREMAIRAALGGSRASIVRQVLIESLVLALGGGALGVLLAFWGVRALGALPPPDVPRLSTVSIDSVVLGYAATVTILTAVIFGLIPALQSSRGDLMRTLRDRGTPSGHLQHRVRGAAVVSEVALSLVLLVGAGLMVRSFMALRTVDPGYDGDRVLTFGVQLPGPRYPTPEQRVQFITTFRERLAALPGVVSAGGATPLPLSGIVSNGPYGTEAVLSDPERFQQAEVRIITEGYIETMDTRVIDGRVFTDRDRSTELRHVVVDETLARKTWPGERAVGKRLMVRFGGPDYLPVEVLGVVEHQRSGSLAAEGRETLYYHDAAAGGPGGLTWVVRTEGDPQVVIPAIRRLLTELDPALPLTAARTMRELMDASMAPTRFALMLMGVFGVTALVLAAIGLYSVLAFSVRERTAEIGVRMAFGASRSTILAMVMRQGLRLTAGGMVIGVLAAFALTRVIASQLVGVRATDPLTFLAVVAVFLSVAAIACAVPAWRALRVDPLVALREE